MRTLCQAAVQWFSSASVDSVYKTSMAPLWNIFLILAPVFSSALAAESSLPDGMHQDLYCVGCETTIKVLDSLLRRVPKDQLDVTIAEVMDTVCEPDNFDMNEFSKDALSDACNHLISEHGSVLEAVLISHYGRSSTRPSYLDLVQQVCQDVTDACHGVSHNDHNHDPLRDDARVKLDRDTNEFVVQPGKNLKMPRPVSESKDEL